MTTHNTPDSNEQGEVLKACPFCADALIEVRGNEWDEDFRATCIGCLASSGRYRTKAEAIKAWNTRASVAAVEGDAVMRVLERIARCVYLDEPPCWCDEVAFAAEQDHDLDCLAARALWNQLAAASSPAPVELPNLAELDRVLAEAKVEDPIGVHLTELALERMDREEDSTEPLQPTGEQETETCPICKEEVPINSLLSYNHVPNAVCQGCIDAGRF